MDSKLFQQSLLTGKIVTAWDGIPEKSRALPSDKAVHFTWDFGCKYPYLIPAEILNDYYISRGNIDSFRELRMSKTKRPYDPRLFVVVKKIVESQRRTKIEKIIYAPNSLPKTVERALGYGKNHGSINLFPSNRVIFSTGDPDKVVAPCPFVGKERFEGGGDDVDPNENPCIAGAKNIIRIVNENEKRLNKYNDDVDKYLTAKQKWDSKRDDELSDCRDFANRTCHTGWTSPTASSNTIARKCDDRCLNTYGGRYKYTGKADNKNAGTRWKYYCRFSNPITTRKTCIQRWESKHPEPVKPLSPVFAPIPEFICQNCPNTINIEDGSTVDESSVLSQANSCIIQQEKTTNINVDTPSPDIDIPDVNVQEEKDVGEKNGQESKKAIDDVMTYIIMAIVVSLIIGATFFLRRKRGIGGSGRSRINSPPFN